MVVLILTAIYPCAEFGKFLTKYHTLPAQLQERAQAEGWAAGDTRLAVALAQLSQQWNIAEELLLGQGEAGSAVEMYRGLGMLKDAVRSDHCFHQFRAQDIL